MVSTEPKGKSRIIIQWGGSFAIPTAAHEIGHGVGLLENSGVQGKHVMFPSLTLTSKHLFEDEADAFD